jgi:hypothetical protein
MSTSVVALHRLLLRVADHAPDDLLHAARGWLAAGRTVEVAEAVAFAAYAGTVRLDADDVEPLRAALRGTGTHPDLLAALTATEGGAAGGSGSPYGLAPVDPRALAEYGATLPYTLDLTAAVAFGTGWLDEVDAAAVAAVADVAAASEADVRVRALWRSWCYPSPPAPWPPPKRLYLVLTTASDEAPLPPLADWLARALVAAGEADPRVEVFGDADALPPFHRAALGLATLLWTGDAAPPMRIAALFDAVDEAGGPGFAPEHPRLDAGECDHVLAYLDRGAPLLPTTTEMADVVDPERGGVPMSFRTDGQFIWTEAVAYYLANYRLAPEPALLDHIRARRYEMPEVDLVALHRATSALQTPMAERHAT